MGINGSATCVLNFGESDGCEGELVGTVENLGMSQMFRMMNGARIAVGIQGLATAAAAYQNAVDYARDRKQGRTTPTGRTRPCPGSRSSSTPTSGGCCSTSSRTPRASAR
jgi:alkylation response protein AidB-like acyl-CoA dehydrogenase